MRQTIGWVLGCGLWLSVVGGVMADPMIRRELQRFDELLMAGQAPQAMQTFMGLKAKFPDDVDVRAYEGKILMMQNNPQGAEVALRAALEKQPHHPLATAWLANLEFRTFKVQEAQARVTAALEEHPAAWELLQIAAEILTAQQKLAEAQPFWQKIAETPTNPPQALAQARAQLGGIALQQGQPAEAAESLKQSLAIHWDLGVALAYAQALDQAQAEIALLREVTQDIRQRVNAATGHPQQAQIRQHVDQQLAAVEAKLQAAAAADRSVQALADLEKTLAAIDTELAKDDCNTFTVQGDLREARRLLVSIAEGPVRAAKTVAVQDRELQREVRILRDGIAKDFSPAWKQQQAEKVETAAAGLSGAATEAALALVTEIRAEAAQVVQGQIKGALTLARTGWRLENFYSPDGDQAVALQQHQLPPRYLEFHPDVRDALAKHYEPLAARREQIPLEPAVAAYIQAPTDAAARAKAIDLMDKRLKGIPVSVAGAPYAQLIPAQVWVRPHGQNRALNIDNPLAAKRELAWSLRDRLQITSLQKNQRWPELVVGLTRSIETYPRPSSLWLRAEAHLLNGHLQQAWEDTLLSLAVDAWERANAIGAPDTEGIGRTTEQRLIAAKMLGELARNKPSRRGDFASAPLGQFLQNLREGKWDAVAEHALVEHPAWSVDALLISRLRYGQYGTWRRQMLDAVTAEYASAKPAQQAALLAATEGWDRNHAGLAMIRYRAASEEAREALLFDAVENGLRDPAAYYELGRYYEQRNEPGQAMLAYNVAANGEDAETLSGVRREAALARGRFEGRTPDFQTMYKVYQPHHEALSERTANGRSTMRESAYYEGLVNRLLRRQASEQSVLGLRADSRRVLGDYAGAIADLNRLIELKSDLTPLAHAVIGNNWMDLGAYPQAIAAFTQAVDQGNHESWVFLQRATCWAHQGQDTQALVDLNLAVEKDPTNAEAFVARSEYYEYIADDDEKALGDVKTALAIRKEKNPNGNFFALNLRASNLEMKIGRRNINRMFGLE